MARLYDRGPGISSSAVQSTVLATVVSTPASQVPHSPSDERLSLSTVVRSHDASKSKTTTMSTQVRVTLAQWCSWLQSLSYGKKASRKALVGAAKECPPRVGVGRVPNMGPGSP